MSERTEPTGFPDRAEGLLSRLESAVDRIADDLDIDIQRTGNVITLTFENDHRIIVNTQEAAGEIWVAARSGGFHYRWNDASSRWRDTRSDEDIGVALARLIGSETGTPTPLAI
jgi:CyaY protein